MGAFPASLFSSVSIRMPQSPWPSASAGRDFSVFPSPHTVICRCGFSPVQAETARFMEGNLSFQTPLALLAIISSLKDNMNKCLRTEAKTPVIC